MRILAVLYLLAQLCLPVTAFAAKPPANSKASLNATPPADSELQQTIQTKLAKSKIGKDGFRFRVSHGVVTWEGATNVVQHKGSATRMAKSAGAIKVVNNIQVSAAGKAKAAQGLRKAAVTEN